jgi:hypothetical protein
MGGTGHERGAICSVLKICVVKWKASVIVWKLNALDGNRGHQWKPYGAVWGPCAICGLYCPTWEPCVTVRELHSLKATLNWMCVCNLHRRMRRLPNHDGIDPRQRRRTHCASLLYPKLVYLTPNTQLPTPTHPVTTSGAPSLACRALPVPILACPNLGIPP